MTDYTELERLEAAATKGPWHAVNYADTWINLQDGPDYSDADLLGSCLDDNEYKRDVPFGQAVANGDFIAAIRNAAPALIAKARAYDALLAANERLAKHIDDINGEAEKVYAD